MEILEKKKKNMTRPGSKPTILTALPQDHKILYEMLAKILILKDKCFHQIEPKYNKGPFLYYVRVFLAFSRPPTHPCKE